MNSRPDGIDIPPPAANSLRRAAPLFAGPWPMLVLLLLALLPYLGVLRNDFTYIYDDKAQIIDNPYVHSFGHLREILTTPVWSFKDAHNTTNYYRPVMTLGFLLCFQIFGPLAFGFHLFSLLLHAAVVAMLFWFAEELLRDRSAAFLGAAIFALHPVHVESIAWISAVTDIEVTFFFVLTFWCFLRVGERNGKQQIAAQAAMTGSFLLAVLSKEQALMLPLLAAIYEVFYREDRGTTTWGVKIGRQALLWLAALGYFLMRLRMLGTVAHSTGMHPLTLKETVLSAIALVGRYTFKLFWPARLSAFYVFHASTRLFEPWVLAGIGGLVLTALVFAWLWRHSRPASFGMVWFFVTLGPVLNARWLGAYVFTERYFYLPSVGFCILAGWAGAGLWRLAARQAAVWRVGLATAAGFLATLCIIRIVTRIPDWRDDVTLITHALASEPHEYILHDALGDAFWIRGKDALAELEWKEALRINPTFARPVDALGALYARQRRFGEAREFLQQAILLSPDNAEAHMNLGAVYAETGRLDLAERQFRIGVALAPLNFSSHNILGKLYLDSGRLDEAEEQFRLSLKCDPNVAALDNLGYIDERRGDKAGAEKAFRAALALNADDSHAHYHLGLIYAAAGRDAQAVDELKAALAADPGNPEVLAALKKLNQ